MKRVCIWPDGDWCNIEDLELYNWKSDDYEEKVVPLEWEGGE